MKKILDMTCSGRMIWYQTKNSNVELIIGKALIILGLTTLRGEINNVYLLLNPPHEQILQDYPFQITTSI